MIDPEAPARPLVATCSRGLEEVLADELRALEVSQVEPGRGIVGFVGDLEAVWRTNLWLRTAMRVVVPLARGAVAGRGDLYALAAGIAWPELLRRGQTVAVDVAGRSRAVPNTAFAAQVVKDAVVDAVRAQEGWRPSVDRADPDLRLHLHLSDRETSLGMDSTGEPLSHRGYRPRGGPAPLAETLAAGVLLLAGYDGTEPLLDPMCGTGTFLVEAAMIATRTPPGRRRRFAFERWAGHDQERYREVITGADRQGRDAPEAIAGFDRDRRAVAAARSNLAAVGMNPWATVETRDVLDLELPWEEGGLIVANPPYGKRMGDVESLGALYRGFGDRLKSHGRGATAWLLVGSRELANHIGLKPSRRIPIFNGPIECRLLKYELYAGSRKPAKARSS